MDDRQLGAAIRRGLGSAIVFLQNVDDKPGYRDIILSYCLRDIGYDVQSEGSKGSYLYFAICAIGDTDYFLGPIIDKFLSGRCRDRLDLQLIDLLVCFAKDGNLTAIQALHARYAQFAARRRLSRGPINWVGPQWEYLAIALLDIDGFSGFKRYITDVGQYILRTPDGRDDPDYDWFIHVATDRFGERRVAAFLDPTNDRRRTVHEQDAVSVLAHTMSEDDARQAHRHRRVNQPLTATDVREWALDSVAGGRRYGSISHAFNKGATEAEKLKLAEAIQDEPDETIRGWMLGAYYRKPFPLGPKPLLSYLDSSDERLRDAAVGVLRVCRDDAIHDTALRLLTTQGLDSGGLALLEANYRRSDEAVIADALRRFHRHLPHHIVMDLRDIYDYHRSVHALPILLRAYREGECGHCRWWIVKAMQRSRILPKDIVDECRFDSYTNTRNLAGQIIART